MSRKVGKVKLTYTLLEQALQMDKKHKIEKIQDSNFDEDEIFWIKVSGPDMPIIAEGQEMSTVDLPLQVQFIGLQKLRKNMQLFGI